jgi:hypothetical protein
MIAILMVVVIRLVLYIDLIFTDRMGAVTTMPEGKTINTMVSTVSSKIVAHADIIVHVPVASGGNVGENPRNFLKKLVIKTCSPRSGETF